MTAIVEALEHAISDGRYPSNTRLPSERELARRFDVPVSVARGALSRLVGKGRAYRIPRGGTFVQSAEGRPRPKSPSSVLQCVNFIEPVRKRHDPFAFALTDYLHGYTRWLELHPLRVRFASLPPAETRFEALLNPALPIEGQACVIGDVLSADWMTWLNDRSVPYVVRRFACYDGNDFPPHQGVYLNRNGASFQAVRHLMDLGHERIGFIGQLAPLTDDDPWRLDGCSHVEGYRSAYCVAGLPTPADCQEQVDGVSQDAIRAAARRLLDRRDRPTALVCQNDLTALVAIQAAHALGIAVPAALSVIGFDNDPAGTQSDPPLTTFAGHESLATAAIRRLFEIARKPAREIRHDVRPVDCTMIQRASTSRFASTLDSPAMAEALTHPASNPNRSARNAVSA